MIIDTYICKTRVFKIVLSLALLNSVGLQKKKKKKKNIYIYIYIYIYLGDPRRLPKWPRPRVGPVLKNPLQ